MLDEKFDTPLVFSPCIYFPVAQKLGKQLSGARNSEMFNDERFGSNQ